MWSFLWFVQLCFCHTVVVWVWVRILWNHGQAISQDALSWNSQELLFCFLAPTAASCLLDSYPWYKFLSFACVPSVWKSSLESYCKEAVSERPPPHTHKLEKRFVESMSVSKCDSNVLPGWEEPGQNFHPALPICHTHRYAFLFPPQTCTGLARWQVSGGLRDNSPASGAAPEICAVSVRASGRPAPRLLREAGAPLLHPPEPIWRRRGWSKGRFGFSPVSPGEPLRAGPGAHRRSRPHIICAFLTRYTSTSSTFRPCCPQKLPQLNTLGRTSNTYLLCNSRSRHLKLSLLPTWMILSSVILPSRAEPWSHVELLQGPLRGEREEPGAETTAPPTQSSSTFPPCAGFPSVEDWRG